MSMIGLTVDCCYNWGLVCHRQFWSLKVEEPMTGKEGWVPPKNAQGLCKNPIQLKCHCMSIQDGKKYWMPGKLVLSYRLQMSCLYGPPGVHTVIVPYHALFVQYIACLDYGTDYCSLISCWLSEDEGSLHLIRLFNSDIAHGTLDWKDHRCIDMMFTFIYVYKGNAAGYIRLAELKIGNFLYYLWGTSWKGWRNFKGVMLSFKRRGRKLKKRLVGLLEEHFESKSIAINFNLVENLFDVLEKLCNIHFYMLLLMNSLTLLQRENSGDLPWKDPLEPNRQVLVWSWL